MFRARWFSTTTRQSNGGDIQVGRNPGRAPKRTIDKVESIHWIMRRFNISERVRR